MKFKRIKKIILISIFITVLSAAIISAANIAVLESYGPNDILSGTINMSVLKASDANFSAKFNDITRNIKFIDFLNNAGTNYSCIPLDCYDTYTASSPAKEKTLTEDYIALVLSGQNVGISHLSFNFSGDSTTKSCGFIPMKIDFLDDGEIDWQYGEAEDSFCTALEPSSTYNGRSTNMSILGSNPYCEKVELIPAERFKLGADIVKGSESDTTVYMSLNDGSSAGTYCELEWKTGQQSCIVNYSVPRKGEYYICIYSESEDIAANTSVKIETEKPNCGKLGTGIFDCSESTRDYALYSSSAFFKPLKNTIIFNAGDDIITIQQYMDGKYGGDCSSGCIIPIKVISNQQLKFSSLLLTYSTDNEASVISSDFYSAKKDSAKVNVSGTLPLEAAKFIVPPIYGNVTLTIMINGETLDSKIINILKVPFIKSVAPLNVYAATSTKFTAYAESPKNNSIVSYDWNFGDGKYETTANASVFHRYDAEGNFTLILTATDSEGLSGKKSFSVYSLDPKYAVNVSIAKKKANLAKLNTTLSSIPSWYSSIITKTVNSAEIAKKLGEFENQTLNASADYIALKLALDNLFVPSEIKDDRVETIMHSETSAEYTEKIDSAKISGDAKGKLKSWNDANIEIRALQNAKTGIEGAKNIGLSTEYKLEIKSKGDELKDIYIIIVTPSADDIIFKEQYTKQKINDAIVLTLDLTKDAKIIEFAIPEKYMADEIRIFASPKAAELEEGTICGDDICDAASGESYSNCPDDCAKPLTGAIMAIIGVLIFAGAGIFVIWKYYAVMYDRKLKEKLFDNEDFEKLTFFITNEMNKDKENAEIRDELSKAGWKSSQIEYGMKKVSDATRKMQKQSVLSYIEGELIKGKSKDEIRKTLEDNGWKPSMISWAFRKSGKK